MGNKIRIRFEFTDEFGDEYASESYVSKTDRRELEIIGEQLNSFLRQAGYVRNGDNILMESLTYKELEAVEEFLDEYRSK